MTVIFNGKAYAWEKLQILKTRVEELKEKKVIPRLAVVLSRESPQALSHLRQITKAAQEIGAEIEICDVTEKKSYYSTWKLIWLLNVNDAVHGIIVELPLSGKIQAVRDRILETVDPQKDIDGLSPDSNFQNPTVRAVLAIIKEAQKVLPQSKKKHARILVIGVSGRMGKLILRTLHETDYWVSGYDKSARKFLQQCGRKADIIISCTGVPGLVKPDIAGEDKIIIDLGSPIGDAETTIIGQAGFLTPVPGGVGPVSVYFLLENLVKAAYNLTKHTSIRSS